MGAPTGCWAHAASSSIRVNSRQFPELPEEEIFGQGYWTILGPPKYESLSRVLHLADPPGFSRAVI